MLVQIPPDVPLLSLFDALPDSVVWMEALRDEQGRLTDFAIRYSNKKAQETASGVYQVSVGTRVLSDNRHAMAFTEKAFAGLADVLETGVSSEFEYFNASLNGWFRVNRSKVGDGVLSVTRNQTAQHEAEQARARQASLFTSVVEASLNGIITYTARREPGPDGPPGRIVDFRAETVNPVAAQILGLPDQQPGWQLLERFPGVKDRGVFDRYVAVVETGEPLRFETPYDADGVTGWFDVAVVKLDDGFVITFNDISAQRQATRQTEEQARLFEGVLQSIPAGLNLLEAVRDEAGHLADFRYLKVSRSMLSDTGLTEQNFLGNSMLTLFPAVKQTAYWPAYERALATGEPQRFEVHYAYEGYDNYLDNVVSRVDEDRLVSTYQIINETRLAGLEVERQNTVLEGILNTSLNGTVVYEALRDEQNAITDFRFRLFNETARQDIRMHTGRDIAGNTLLGIYPNSRETGMFRLYAHVTETGQTQRTEHHYPDLDLWYDVSLAKLEDGCVVTFIDISAAKRAQRAIEQSAGELQAIIDTAQTGIFLFAPVRSEQGEITDFRFRAANRMLAAYVGQNPAAVRGALGSEWFPDYKTNGLFERYRQTYETGETLRFDFHYDGGGIDVWLDIMATKLGDEVLVTFADYTPLKKLQLQLEEYVRKLQRSNENLERFAYVSSHDLQEPLRKIQSFGDMLVRKQANRLDDAGRDLIRRMQEAAGRMQELIQDLLAYSRLSSRHEGFRLVELDALAASVRGDLDVVVGEKNARIELAPLPAVSGDPLQLRQLLQNLLSNALKFSRPGVPPRVQVTHRTVAGADVPASAGLRPEATYHEISVSDNGIGFEPQYADRIFEAFQRLHGRADYAGTGIGLAIVKKVVENHHGGLTVSSQPGEGATFRVYLPV